MNMKIIHWFPPNYEEIKSALPIKKGNIYAYGNFIYNPSGGEIPEDIIVHEGVHQRQQGKEPDVWWKRYLTDHDFRRDEEVEAYRVQYSFIKKHYPSKAHKEALNELAENLSTLYNLNITKSEAETLIRKYK